MYFKKLLDIIDLPLYVWGFWADFFYGPFFTFGGPKMKAKI